MMLDDDCLPDVAVSDAAKESDDDSVYVVDDEPAVAVCAATRPVANVGTGHAAVLEEHTRCVKTGSSVRRVRSQHGTAARHKETAADKMLLSAPIASGTSKPPKDLQKLARLAERQKKAQEKELGKLLKQAMKEQRKAARPGECDKHMVIECDYTLLTTELGKAIRSLADVAQIGCDFREHTMLNTILFKRRRMEYEVDSAAGTVKDVIKSVSLIAEGVAVVLAAMDFLTLVKSFSDERNGITRPQGASISLEEYVSRLRLAFNLQPTVIVIGCDSYFKGTPGKAKKKLPAKGHGSSGQRDKLGLTKGYDVTRVDVEECCVDLQLKNDVGVIHCDTIAEAAETVLHLNKAIAEAPFKREKLAALAADDGVCPAKARKDGASLTAIWKTMLQEIRNVSPDVAEAIVEAYPSPHLLCEAYRCCSDENEATALLEDLQVRRGTGALQTIRRVGKELSRRLYQLFSSSDPSFVIT